MESIYCYLHTHLWQKFREFNGFTEEVTKELISVTANFSIFHTVGNLLQHFFHKNFVKAENFFGERF